MSIKRFSLSQRIAHFLIALSIMSLFITGMPLLFKQHWLIMILGGEKVTMFLHRVFAIVLMATSLYLLKILDFLPELNKFFLFPLHILEFSLTFHLRPFSLK